MHGPDQKLRASKTHVHSALPVSLYEHHVHSSPGCRCRGGTSRNCCLPIIPNSKRHVTKILSTRHSRRYCCSYLQDHKHATPVAGPGVVPFHNHVSTAQTEAEILRSQQLVGDGSSP